MTPFRALLAAPVLALAALPVTPAAAACAGDVTVQLAGYQPNPKTVPVGTTVTWCWREGNHSVTFTGGPDSGVLAKDATWPRTFGTAGSFAYHCSVHGSMQGTVVVQGTGPTTNPPTTPPKATTPPPTKPAPTTTPPRTTAPPVIRTTPPSRFPTPSATTPPTTATSAAPSGSVTGTPRATGDPTVPPATASTTGPAAFDPPPATPRTGLAIVAGLLAALAALGGGGYVLFRRASG